MRGVEVDPRTTAPLPPTALSPTTRGGCETWAALSRSGASIPAATDLLPKARIDSLASRSVSQSSARAVSDNVLVLNRDLVELLNSGEAWAFVGAGASIAAGLPGWSQLIVTAVARLSEDDPEISALPTYKAAMRDKAYPRAFSVIVDRVGREPLVTAIGGILGPYTDPGPIYRRLAAWPVRGYITTNYDPLLIRALPSAGANEFVPIDNDDKSLPALSADPQAVVWHLHGMLSRPSGMILTEGDYDRIYGEGTAVVSVLRSFFISAASSSSA